MTISVLEGIKTPSQPSLARRIATLGIATLNYEEQLARYHALSSLRNSVRLLTTKQIEEELLSLNYAVLTRPVTGKVEHTGTNYPGRRLSRFGSALFISNEGNLGLNIFKEIREQYQGRAFHNTYSLFVKEINFNQADVSSVAIGDTRSDVSWDIGRFPELLPEVKVFPVDAKVVTDSLVSANNDLLQMAELLRSKSPGK